MQIIISILAYIVAIGVLVSVHEFGHFIVARKLGIKVLRFSIGFGRPLFIWHRRGDDTEYVLAALPLGGYVKMLDEREGVVAPAELPRAFNRQSMRKRLAVVLAGPIFNLLFAVLAYWVMYMAGIPGLKPIVGDIRPGSPAAIAGLASQDEIVAVEGRETRTWDAAALALFADVMHGGVLHIGVRSPAGAERQLTLNVPDPHALTEPDNLLPGLGLSPWDPPLLPILDEVTPDGTAHTAGLLPGDRILSVDGQPVASWQVLSTTLKRSAGKHLALLIERDGRQQLIDLQVGVEKTSSGVTGHIGVKPKVPVGWGDSFRAEQRYNPPVALWQAFRHTGDMAWLTLDAAGNMLLGNVSWHNLSGPVEIAQYAGYAARDGLVFYLGLLAFVSISLGVLNLLPIPVLDGGHVLYFAAELVRGAPLSERVEMMGLRFGIGLLMLLMGFAVYNDLVRIFS